MRQQPIEDPWEALRQGTQNDDPRMNTFAPPSGEGAEHFWLAAAAVLNGISHLVDAAASYVENQLESAGDPARPSSASSQPGPHQTEADQPFGRSAQSIFIEDER